MIRSDWIVRSTVRAWALPRALRSCRAGGLGVAGGGHAPDVEDVGGQEHVVRRVGPVEVDVAVLLATVALADWTLADELGVAGLVVDLLLGDPEPAAHPLGEATLVSSSGGTRRVGPASPRPGRPGGDGETVGSGRAAPGASFLL